MQKIEPSSISVVLNDEFVLGIIFSYIPLSSASNITLVSKTFRDIWNKTRYDLAIKRLFESDISFSHLQNIVSTLQGPSDKPETINRNFTSLRTLKKTVEIALENLCSSDKTVFFAHLRSEIPGPNQSRIVAIFISLKHFFYPWTPRSIDLIEKPDLLINTCERAIRRQSYSEGVYFPAPYNAV